MKTIKKTSQVFIPRFRLVLAAFIIATTPMNSHGFWWLFSNKDDDKPEVKRVKDSDSRGFWSFFSKKDKIIRQGSYD